VIVRGDEHGRLTQVETVQTYLPYFLLAVSVALAFATGPRVSGYDVGTGAYTVTLLGLAAFAALWIAFVRGPYATRALHKVRAGVYYAGLLGCLAALIVLNPFFAFFAFTGYLHVTYLPGWWKAPAIAGAATLMALSQVGGVAQLHGVGIFGFAVLAPVNTAIAGALTYVALMDDRRSAQREEMLKERDEANRRLQLMMEENAGLHAQLVTQAREAGALDERQRMAGEIHDTLAQGLIGILAQLEAAQVADADPRRRHRHLELADRLARDSLAEARRSVQALRPGPLADAHLPEALANLAEQWNQTSGIPVRVEVDGPAVPLQPALEVTLFRAAQEALANIAKHSAATQAGMTLSYTHDVVVLDVLDDGAGFDPAAQLRQAASQLAGSPAVGVGGGGEVGDGVGVDGNVGAGYGLSAMRRRLRQVGGTLEIESAVGDGTTVSASVPALRLEGDC
jgi:signal transduction histidine kinase